MSAANEPAEASAASKAGKYLTFKLAAINQTGNVKIDK